jgi:hypothetical protein
VHCDSGSSYFEFLFLRNNDIRCVLMYTVLIQKAKKYMIKFLRDRFYPWLLQMIVSWRFVGRGFLLLFLSC